MRRSNMHVEHRASDIFMHRRDICHSNNYHDIESRVAKAVIITFEVKLNHRI